ncbi:MAG: response regulator [Candidatus Cloacimonadaceae bacterium]|nr:response regulator [Candidatus Cloacimonadaceae bacterium]
MEEKTILLVEDNPNDVELTKRALKKNNIINKLIVAEDGVLAMDYLMNTGIYEGENNKLPTLILLDLKLPRVDGLEVLKSIRNNPRTKRLPVVVLTSSKEDQDLINSYDLGCNSYIRKPVDFNQFNDAIKSLGLYWLVINETPPECN